MLAVRIRSILLKNYHVSLPIKFDRWVEGIGLGTVRMTSIQMCDTSTNVVRSVVKCNYHTLCQREGTFWKLDSPILVSTRNQVRKAESSKSDKKDIVHAKDKPYGELSTSQKVAQAGKDATYTTIVIAGIAVTGAIFFAIGRELLSGQSPSGIYSKALKLIRNHDDIIVYMGEPIKGYGETNRRGRRRHVSHQEYEKDGVKHMRMKFYVEGTAKKGTVHLEAKQNENRKYEFRYLFVDLDDYPRRTIVIQDNR